MSPVDAAIIRRKLPRIAASLEGLRPIGRLGVEEYRARFYERKAAERLLQEAIEAAKVLSSIGTLLHLYPRYIEAVEAYLTRAGL